MDNIMQNELYYGDNLEIIKNHIKDEIVDLIYLDPPFNSNRDYNVIYDNALAQTKAFGDTWSIMKVEDLEYLIEHGEPQRYATLRGVLDGLKQILFYSVDGKDKSMYAYLLNMGVRLVEMHRVLKETGSIYLHCDPTASHYLKILMDSIFGKKNFRREIIWSNEDSSGFKSKAKNWIRGHDTILYYLKDISNFYFKAEYMEFNAKTIKRYDKIDSEGRRYKVYKDEKGDRIAYLSPDKGAKISSVWKDIPSFQKVNNTGEYMGYPTQKPVALLNRIIEASCPEGGVVLDPYCGCGTTIASSHQLKRKWIGIDITYVAIDLIQQRLIDNFYIGGEIYPTDAQRDKAKIQFLQDTRIFGIPRDLESARKLARETKGDYVRKEFEKWAVFSVGGVYYEKKGADGGVDGSFNIYDFEDGKQKKKVCYVQVKSGKVGERDIRDFDSVLTSFKAPIGVFVTLEEPTKKMLEYAAQLPKYINALGQSYPRITIITIEQILREDVPDFAVRATRRAQASERIQDNLEF
jgi:DNA modification methylase